MLLEHLIARGRNVFRTTPIPLKVEIAGHVESDDAYLALIELGEMFQNLGDYGAVQELEDELLQGCLMRYTVLLD
jgi:hypothetical protein